MDKKNSKNSLPTTQEINASSPGTLAMERFKLALAIDEDNSQEAQELKNQLLDDHTPEDDG